MIDVAVSLVVEAGDSQAADRTERHVEAGIQAQCVVAAVAGRGIAAEALARLARDEVDRAAGGIATVQRALWSAQHFDAIHVEQRHRQDVGAIDVFAIDVDDDRSILGFVVGGRADAAHGDLHRALVLVQLHDRRDLVDVVHVGEAGIAQLLRIDHVDRDRNILDALLAVLRRDDDFLECGLFGRGREDRRHGQRGDEHAEADQYPGSEHLVTPPRVSSKRQRARARPVASGLESPTTDVVIRILTLKFAPLQIRLGRIPYTGGWRAMEDGWAARGSRAFQGLRRVAPAGR